jgi:hypothetical protein
MNPGGGPTPDKPDVILAPPQPGDPVSSFLNVRVADIAAFYADAKSKGAQFLTEPLDRKAEIRCYYATPTATSSRSGRPLACSAASTPTSTPRTASTFTLQLKRHRCTTGAHKANRVTLMSAAGSCATYSISTRISVSCSDTVVGKGSARLPGPIKRTHRRVGNRSPPA